MKLNVEFCKRVGCRAVMGLTNWSKRAKPACGMICHENERLCEPLCEDCKGSQEMHPECPFMLEAVMESQDAI
jgi:hypothetical protein